MLYANSADADQMPPSAVSDLGLHCLPRSQKRDARLIWVIMLLAAPHFGIMFRWKKDWSTQCQDNVAGLCPPVSGANFIEKVYEGSSVSSCNLVIKCSNIDILLSCCEISQEDIRISIP